MYKPIVAFPLNPVTKGEKTRMAYAWSNSTPDRRKTWRAKAGPLLLAACGCSAESVGRIERDMPVGRSPFCYEKKASTLLICSI